MAYQFSINAQLTPPFSIFLFFFSVRPKLQLSGCKISEFPLPNLSFFKENLLPRPYLWKPVRHIPPPKRIECPLPRARDISLNMDGYILFPRYVEDCHPRFQQFVLDKIWIASIRIDQISNTGLR